MRRQHYGRGESDAEDRTPTSEATARRIPVRANAPKIEYERRSIQHGTIKASARVASLGCKTGAGPPRVDQVDLIFASRKAKAIPGRGPAPTTGPALRFCTHGQGWGTVLSIASPREAKRIAVAYQECIASTKAKTEKQKVACVRRVAGEAPLAFGDEAAGRVKIRRRRSR